jgi:hypothetical protein
VNSECDLGELLQDYGYAIVPDPHREQQFRCDLHGADNKPSARYYPENNSTWCWPCSKKRDPLDYVMEKEQINFIQAIDFLEKRLNLDTLAWSDAEEPKPVDEIAELDKISDTRETYEDVKGRVQRLLEMLTEDRALPSNNLLSFWEVFDRVDYGVARQKWPEGQGMSALAKLKVGVMKKLEEAS